jgi:hypothetical protein
VYFSHYFIYACKEHEDEKIIANNLLKAISFVGKPQTQ